MSKGPISQVIDALSDAALRARAKAAALVTVTEKLPAEARTFTSDGLVILIEAGPIAREMANGNLAFEVVLSATRNGLPVALDNPYQFVNPPIMVQSANGDRTEDPFAAVRRMLTDAVLDAEKRSAH